MEALLFTLGLVVVMSGALILLARSWPRSSRLTGYRIKAGRPQTELPPVPEDDDAHWRWKDRPR